MKQNLFERASSSILTVAAVAIATALVHREFFGRPTSSGPNPSDPPVYVDNWESFRESGITMGAQDARIVITEFADFQCPFCARYEPTLRNIQEKYPNAVARLFIHFPLSEIHVQARPAAVASECALEQGRFEEMADVLFAKHDSLGRIPWSVLAARAGVPDTNRFARCTNGPAPTRIERGHALARKLNLTGTPTILVNGWKYYGGPPDTALTSAIEALLAGKTPRGAKR